MLDGKSVGRGALPVFSSRSPFRGPTMRVAPFRSGSFLVLLVVAGFMGGALAERSGWMAGSALCPAAHANLHPLCEAWSLVDKHYVDRAAIKPQVMTGGAIEGMLAALGDVGHTS